MELRKIHWQPIAVLLFAVVVTFALAGCQSPKPNPPGEQPQAGQQAESVVGKLAFGYMVNAQVRDTTAKLIKLKKITAEDGKRVLVITDLARAGLDQAKQLAFANRDAEAVAALSKVEVLHRDAQIARDQAETDLEKSLAGRKQ